MDSCPFVRLIIESLALKLPPVSKPSGHGVYPSTNPNPCFCTLHLQDYSHPSNYQTAPLPLAASTAAASLTDTPDPTSLSSPAVFSLDQSRSLPKRLSLIMSVYTGRSTESSTCGFVSRRRMLGRVRVGVDVETAGARAMVMQSGWVSLGSGPGPVARLHLVVRSEPDPRFVLEFGGEPECSPVVYQVQGSGSGVGLIRQPVFSCQFSTDRRRTTRSRSLPTESSRSATIRTWLTTSGRKGNHIRSRDQRKGWTVTIHDLSGSPVAAASMVTPFVPSPGSDRVSRSNPGAWLILRPTGFSTTNWKPWARFEAWRERGPIDALGYKFELVTENGPNSGLLIAESAISVKKGGYFKIDPSVGREELSRSWPFVGGFVMESTVEGEGKTSKPTMHVGVQHVTSMGD